MNNNSDTCELVFVQNRPVIVFVGVALAGGAARRWKRHSEGYQHRYEEESLHDLTRIRRKFAFKDEHFFVYHGLHYCFGKLRVTVVPWPGSLAIWAEPPCKSMIDFTRARPNPTPSELRAESAR